MQHIVSVWSQPSCMHHTNSIGAHEMFFHHKLECEFRVELAPHCSLFRHYSNAHSMEDYSIEKAALQKGTHGIASTGRVTTFHRCAGRLLPCLAVSWLSHSTFSTSNVSSINLLGNIHPTNGCARKAPDPAAQRKCASQVNSQVPHTLSLAIAHTTTNADVKQITVLTKRNEKPGSQEQWACSSSHYLTTACTQISSTGLSALGLSNWAKQ